MQNYKEVCGTQKEIWLEVMPSDCKEFLRWAKNLGCVWITGKEICPNKDKQCIFFAIQNDGKLAHVSMHVWFAKSTAHIARFVFCKRKSKDCSLPNAYYLKEKHPTLR